MRTTALCAGLLILLSVPCVSAAGSETRIISAVIDPHDLVSGGPVSATIETTPDVVTVEAIAGPRHIEIPQVEPGHYYGAGTIPHLPHFIHGHFKVRFIGHTAQGETCVAETTIKLN